eukprot:12966_1
MATTSLRRTETSQIEHQWISSANNANNEMHMNRRQYKLRKQTKIKPNSNSLYNININQQHRCQSNEQNKRKHREQMKSRKHCRYQLNQPR